MLNQHNGNRLTFSLHNTANVTSQQVQGEKQNKTKFHLSKLPNWKPLW